MRAAADQPTAKSQHALGQYFIATRQFDKAIEQLTASLDADSRDAKTHSDLGVALLERGKEAQSNKDPGTGLQYFGRSLQHLKKALEPDDSLREARFNLALVLQRMGLQQAEEEWHRYLKIDPDSGWAGEAREHLRALEGRRQQTHAQNGDQALQAFLEAYRGRDDESAWRLLGRNREAIAGRFIPAQLVNSYLASATSGRTGDAAELLDALDYAGELEARKAGDMYTVGVARLYRSAPASRRAVLADGYGFVSKGYEYCRSSLFTEASGAFNEARRTFASVGNDVESAFADYWLAYSYYHSNRTGESRSISQALIQHCKVKGYKWLLAQALNLLSNIQADSHEHSSVLQLTGEALKLSEQVNDAYWMQKHTASLAGKYASSTTSLRR